jgi:hypothetical protein
MKQYLREHTSIINFAAALILASVSLQYPGQVMTSLIILNVLAGLWQQWNETKRTEERVKWSARLLEIEAQQRGQLKRTEGNDPL